GANGCSGDLRSDDGVTTNADDAGADTTAPVDPPTFGDASSDAYDLLEAGCATATADTIKTPAYIEIALDASGSMGNDGKWTAAVAALDAVFDRMVVANDPTVALGLLVFSDDKDATNGFGPYPRKMDVAPRVVDQTQHDALRGRIDTAAPTWGTAT